MKGIAGLTMGVLLSFAVSCKDNAPPSAKPSEENAAAVADEQPYADTQPEAQAEESSPLGAPPGATADPRNFQRDSAPGLSQADVPQEVRDMSETSTEATPADRTVATREEPPPQPIEQPPPREEEDETPPPSHEEPEKIAGNDGGMAGEPDAR